MSASEFIRYLDQARWAQVEAPIKEPWQRFGVLLGKHAPEQPERFRSMVEESYQEVCNAYRYSNTRTEAPPILEGIAHRLAGSMLATLDQIPEASALSFSELVEVHDALVGKFARFEWTGNLLQRKG